MNPYRVLLILILFACPLVGMAQVSEKETIFDVVEEPPSFPGGPEELDKFISNNIVYPSKAKRRKVQGKVYVQFVVYRDGTIGDIKILKGIGAGCDEEALRVVSIMPAWNAGKQKGKPVNCRVILPLKFILGISNSNP